MRWLYTTRLASMPGNRANWLARSTALTTSGGISLSRATTPKPVCPAVSNRGALQTRPTGLVPVMAIDQLALPACDLIMLDIEGDELPALRGAVQTINRYRPVIVAEDKGLGHRKGVVFGDISAWLCNELGYRSAGMHGNDFAFTTQELRHAV